MKPPHLLALLLLCVSAPPREAFSAERPNFLVILADDLGYADVGFNGSTDIPTPALDELAKSGIVFTSGHVAHPVCGPSRTALMTGRLPHTFGTQDNIPPGHPELGIPLSETFLSNLLRDAGYFTGMIGKWHLGAGPEFQPNQRGFDEFYGFLGSGHGYFPSRYEAQHEKDKKAGKAYIDSNAAPLMRNGVEVKENAYLTDAFSREAVKFINTAAKKEQPFFLYLAYNAPHAPMEARREDLEKFAHITDKKRRTYAAMVLCMDRGIGNVVEALKASGEFDNTLIVFFSDNGGAPQLDASNAPLKAGKRDVYEGGHRVPMFFHWPAQVTTGKHFDHPINSLDFYPTFAKLAGAAIPEGKKLDGKDIWSDLMAGTDPHAGEMFLTMSHRHGFTDASGRLGEWKAVKAYQRPWMLYNLTKDIGETHNVGAARPELLSELVAKIQTWADTHEKPLWMYDPKDAEDFKANTKPYFDDTFELPPSP